MRQRDARRPLPAADAASARTTASGTKRARPEALAPVAIMTPAPSRPRRRRRRCARCRGRRRRDARAVRDQPRRVRDADDRRDAELARDDRAVRQHAAALDDQAGDQREDRRPSPDRSGASRGVAAPQPVRLGDVGSTAARAVGRPPQAPEPVKTRRRRIGTRAGSIRALGSQACERQILAFAQARTSPAASSRSAPRAPARRSGDQRRARDAGTSRRPMPASSSSSTVSKNTSSRSLEPAVVDEADRRCASATRRSRL